MNNRDALEKGLAELGVILEVNQKDKLLNFLVLLDKWNKVYNLTAIRNPEQMVSNHLLDSLAILPYLWKGRWLDVGCGAGLPGLVLAIARPTWTIDLLDSNSKKTSFVQQAAIELNLSNVRVVCARVETWKPDIKYDGIVSRAFSDLGIFIKLTQHLLKSDGRWAAMKGLAEKETIGINKICNIEKIVSIKVPGLHAARSLVIASREGRKAI